MNKDLKVNVDGDTKELVIRHGEAKPIKQPESLEVTGDIRTVYEYLQKRNIQEKETYIRVNYEIGQISAKIGEKEDYPTKVFGQIVESKEMQEWGINTDKAMQPKEWAVFMKKRKFYFNNKDKGQRVISELMRFKGDVEKHVQDNDDKKGNVTLHYEQAITTNLPESFSLRLPFFKNDNMHKIEVEFVVDPDNYQTSIISEGLYTEFEERKRELMDEEIDSIRKKYPDIPIIYF
jgi:hypothetical protein